MPISGEKIFTSFLPSNIPPDSYQWVYHVPSDSATVCSMDYSHGEHNSFSSPCSSVSLFFTRRIRWYNKILNSFSKIWTSTFIFNRSPYNFLKLYVKISTLFTKFVLWLANFINSFTNFRHPSVKIIQQLTKFIRRLFSFYMSYAKVCGWPVKSVRWFVKICAWAKNFWNVAGNWLAEDIFIWYIHFLIH